jgi:hypothetical protein
MTRADSAAARDALELARDLAAHGLRPRLHQRGAQFTTAGVTARVALGSLAATPAGPGRAVAARAGRPDSGLSVVYAALRAGIPVTVTIIDPAGQASDAGLAEFRRRFCDFLNAAAVDRDLLGLCLSASELPSAEFRSSIRPNLGDGPRYVMLHEQTGADRRDRSRDAAVWRLLRMEEQGTPRFWPVFPAGVRSQCPLLSSESSSGVLPGSGLAAPLGSAWLPIDLDICQFADAKGVIDVRRLDRALDACIDLGDCLLDHLSWFDDRQRQDAKSNRRLAVCPAGFGDLVVRRGENPADLDCLQRLDALLADIRAGLWQRSKRLAASRGPLPALADHSPRVAWRDDAHRRDWQHRWRNAVFHEQVRHRNLLAMSPYALLPRHLVASPEFADLLPLLGHADVLSFARPPSLAHWNDREFRSFHQRVGAHVERHNAASLVAAGV